MNVVVSGVPFWIDARATWTALGASHSGIKTVYGGPLKTNAQKQADEIDALLSQGISGLIIAPADSAGLAPAIDRAIAKNVPVVTFLVDSPTSKRLAYVGSEEADASEKVASYVASGLSASSKAIVLYAQAGNEEQEDRRSGFLKFSKQHPELFIVATLEDNYDESVAASQLRPLITKYQDVKYIFGCDSRSAVGAVTALKDLHVAPGTVTVTGWDEDKDVLDLISSGWVKASVAQNSSYMTMLAFSILDAQVGGYLYPSTRKFAENSIRPLPEKIIVPVQLVTKDNVQGYYPKP